MRVRLGVECGVLVAATTHPVFLGAEIAGGQAHQLVEQVIFGFAQSAPGHCHEQVVDDLHHPPVLAVDRSDAEFQIVSEGERGHRQILEVHGIGGQSFPVRRDTILLLMQASIQKYVQGFRLAC